MQIYFYPFGNLDDFHLGTWTDFAWELGQFLLGNLDVFFLLSICTTHKKKDAMHCVSTDEDKYIYQQDAL